MERRLAVVVVADDYGYWPGYDAGILAAAREGLIDAVSVMVGRDPDPEPLAGLPVDVGLHLELTGDAPMVDQLAEQLGAFERRFRRPPAHVDGHKHCHAGCDVALAVARAARSTGTYVRAVDATHRRLLRSQGVPTADLLVGRLSEDEPALPTELDTPEAIDAAISVVEWMTHPGHAGGPSSYDAGREQDLALLSELGDRDRWRARGLERARPSQLAH